MEGMEFSRIKFPEMRTELMSHLRALSDPDYQRMAWIDHRYPSGIKFDEFDYVIHFFYDDTDLASDPDSLIGEILENKEEASSIKQLVRELDALFDRYGLDLRDGEYMDKPEWMSIVARARESCLIFNIIVGKCGSGA
jgi:hypothetical protein